MTTRKTTMKSTTSSKTSRPAAAKQPADRQRPAGKAEANERDRVMTINGLKVTIAYEAMNDFELLDDLAALERERNPAYAPSILRRLTGDQWSDLLDTARNENGRVEVDAGIDLLSQIMGELNPNS